MVFGISSASGGGAGIVPGLNRRIFALALPAFGALVAEPLFVMADSAIVGHLGTAPLAGLTLGSTLIQTVVGLMVFLSYSTTPAVARAFGEADYARAFTVGRNGMWAGLFVGVLLAGLGWFVAEPVLGALGGTGQMLDDALAYVRPSLWGLPGMLLLLAAVGVLRGLQDTRTPLVVAGVGVGVNLVLDWVLVYPVGLGVAGSAIATAVVQWAMAVVLGALVVRGMFAYGVPLVADVRGVGVVFAVGSWLMLRTLCMRGALLATVFVVTAQGTENLAAYQVTMSFFSFLAFALDSLAIAAQALLAKELGARDLNDEQGRAAVINLKDRLIRWSLWFGVFTGLCCLPVGFFGGVVFTSDVQVQHLFALAVLVVAVGQPVASYVFVLDGILIGAEDVRYLAVAACGTLVAYVPMLVAVHVIFSGGVAGFVWLWVCYALGYMGARAGVLGPRVRGGVWIR